MSEFKLKFEFWVLASILNISFMLIHTAAAQGIVTVDQVKGRAQITVPLTTISEGSLSLPISLDYEASGVKLEEEGKEYGLGWYLNAGGTIVRTLNDLPDDRENVGWLFGNTASLVESFTIANDNNWTTCTDESADFSYIYNNFPIEKDVEPDIFNVSAPGLSCQIVFDKNHQPKVIPYNDYKIAYTINSGGISTFTITKDNGTQYYFTSPDLSKKKASNLSSSIAPYLRREYEQYKTEIAYYSTWYLQSITDVSGNSIFLDYVTVNGEISTSQIKINEKNGSGNFVTNTLYIISDGATTKKNISSITGNNSVRFEYRDEFLNHVILPGERTLNFNYADITAGTVAGATTTRKYLKSMHEVGCDALPPYRFFYKGIDLNLEKSVLPPSVSLKKDAWGYYNASTDTLSAVPKVFIYPDHPKEKVRLNPIPGYTGQSFVIAGADRSSNPSTVAIGTLNEIVYPAGGSTQIEYEINNYFDEVAQTTFNGGGVRVKKIIHSDGLNAANNIVTEYSYLTPSTGRTSGKVLSLPGMAFVRASTGNRLTQGYWESSIVRSEDDLSKESTTILYGFVTVKKNGLGKTVNEYSNPGSFWDQAIGDWSPTTLYVSRVACVDHGELVNKINAYPFAPNPNYGFKRGQLKSTTLFSEAGLKVSRVEYSYIPTNAPFIINGIKLDENNATTLYAKYKILAYSGDQISIKKEIQYDLGNETKYSEISSTYSYNSTAHKQLTKLSTTNSDGTVYNTYYKYVKDFPSVSTSDTVALALKGMKGANVNSVIEVYKSVLKTGGTESYISADLTKFLSSNNPLFELPCFIPTQNLQFLNPDGIPNFQPSSLSSNGTFQHDGRYQLLKKYEGLNKYGRMRTIVSKNASIASLHLHGTFRDKPVISVENARYDELVYSSFENFGSDASTEFVPVGYTRTDDNRTGGTALQASQTSYMEKNVNKANVKNYVFSAWIKSTVNGNLSVGLTASNGTMKNYTLPYSISSDWKYYEISVPVSDMTSTFNIKVQGSTAFYIDDVVFFPETALFLTYSYDRNGNLLSKTNQSGQTNYYEYDRLGRLRYIRDTDKNIIRKESYLSYNSPPSLSAPTFKFDASKLFDGIAVPFEVGDENSCLLGMTYSWDFGDGTLIATGNRVQSHLFNTPGTYQVKVTAIHPTLGSQTRTETVFIQLRPLEVEICASGIVRVDNCRFEQPLIGTCPGVTTPSNRTDVTISSLTGCTGTYTYQWEKCYPNGSWTTVGTGASYSSPVNPLHNNGSYLLRLKVSSSCGRTGESKPFQFIGYNSTPDCLPQ